MIGTGISGSLRHTLEASLGSEISSVIPASGGCINQSASLNLRDGRRLFLKWHPSAPPAMFLREAEGLHALRACRSIDVPEPLAATEASGDTPAFIVMQDVSVPAKSPQSKSGSFDEQLGHGLAEVHRCTAPGFGFPHDNYIGPTTQPNSWQATWPEFFREKRIEHMLKLLQPTKEVAALASRFLERLPRLLEGACEPPSLLHGDLWSGNVMQTGNGGPALIDPAVYYGHREADLAMTELFGGFGATFRAAYHEAFPLDPGYADRRDIYNLYHVLNHALLFGGGYMAQAMRIMKHYA